MGAQNTDSEAKSSKLGIGGARASSGQFAQAGRAAEEAWRGSIGHALEVELDGERDPAVSCSKNREARAVV